MHRSQRLLTLVSLLFCCTALSACDPSAGAPDASGDRDAASADAAGLDARMTLDAPAATDDVGLADAPLPDPDARLADDASMPEPDASALDAWTSPGDGGLADGGLDGGRDAGRDGGSDTGPDAGPPPGYDVFVLAGQSNMVGRGSPDADPVLDAAHPEIWQWGRFAPHDGTIVPATARLEHNDTALLARVGMGLSFARAYFDAQAAPRPILLVPTARGGSSFSANQWNPGDPLFEDTVARANAAMASHPGNRLVAILWHQGENDVTGGYSTAQYASAVDTLIYRLRARVTGAATAPVILGQFSPDWTPTAPTKTAVLAAIDATPSRVPFTAVAPSAGLSGNAGDLIHFDAASQRAYGARYFDALADALANVPTVSLPGAPTGLAAAPGSATLALTWTAPASAGGGTLLGYRVEWRPSAGGAWTATFSATPSLLVSGLAPATSYEVRVLAQNEAGLGPAATRTATTLAAGTPPVPELRFTFDAGDASNSGSAGAAGDGVGSAGVAYVTDPIRGAVAQITRPTGVITVSRALHHTGYSISAWVLLTVTSGSANIVSSTNGGATAGAHYFFRTGASPFVIGGAHVSATRIVEDVAALPASTWAHYALTYDASGAGTMRLYRDGALVSSATSVTALSAPMPSLFLGAASASGASGMQGLLDDVRIYDRALTATEVSDIHAAELP